MTDPSQSERMERRTVARDARLRQRRRIWALGAAGIVLVAVLLASGKGSSVPDRRTGGQAAAARRASAVVPGGPVAPAGVGGLAALWAPQNVVASQRPPARRTPRLRGWPAFPAFC